MISPSTNATTNIKYVLASYQKESLWFDLDSDVCVGTEALSQGLLYQSTVLESLAISGKHKQCYYNFISVVFQRYFNGISTLL